MFFIVQILSDIKITIRVYFYSPATLLIISKLSFIDTPIFMNINALAYSSLPFNNSKIYFPLAFDKFQFTAV